MSSDLDPTNGTFQDGDLPAVFVEVKPSVLRRYFGLAVLYLLGAIILYVAFVQPPAELIWQLFLFAFGGVVVYLGEKMRKATLEAVQLTKDGLFSTDGTKLVGIENVRSIDRGVFAFKPSNGFTVNLYKKEGRAWAPGLWWRLGKRVGVGGVVQASHTKSMAEVLAAMVHQRNHGQD
ncbi:hypothetical protein ACFE33_13150 [Falsihalocynthiibacter sp. SS001]|uniref:hypothetical protein n=1 Tax=Falsihalocynthiibacter sp. SS001 TaxID=3349698 RepID=UPI0036D349A8